MYDKILVAVDGSEIAQRALQEAIKLARQGSTRLRILHVVDETPLWQYPDGVGVNYEAVIERFRETGRQVGAEALEAARAEGVEAESALLELAGAGRVADVIVQDAKDWGARLIVLGTHGRRGVAHLVLGSVAEGVSRAASTPVLLVR
ncbi:MAG TPA: universal stress protein [Burkholderiales bacterium]|nr:universal stress protein [Burkholderiales bacterium]